MSEDKKFFRSLLRKNIEKVPNLSVSLELVLLGFASWIMSPLKELFLWKKHGFFLKIYVHTIYINVQ